MFSQNQVHILRDRIADSKSGHSLAHAMNGCGYLFYRANKCCKTIYDQLFNYHTNVDSFTQGTASQSIRHSLTHSLTHTQRDEVNESHQLILPFRWVLSTFSDSFNLECNDICTNQSYHIHSEQIDACSKLRIAKNT